AFFVGIGIRALWTLYGERRVEREVIRLTVGAVLATALVVLASSVVAGTPRAWPEFFKNTVKHADTPLTNHMGLRTVLGFRWGERQAVMYDPDRLDPYAPLKEARRESRHGAGAILSATLFAAYLALLVVALSRRTALWVASTLSFGLIAVAFELTCYYYSFLTTAAFLGEEREEVPIGLLALSALTGVAALKTYNNDVRYYLESILVIAFVVWATWRFVPRRRVRASQEASMAAETAPGA
ncbi:MAG TPA: hypothetical protein VFV24_04755, partial [Candidatus Eisenbacteria bacterium]|nr:hypothetical protein [Candidatus Eisenbacteria bacterium]